jgi:hypothetical protein
MNDARNANLIVARRQLAALGDKAVRAIDALPDGGGGRQSLVR